MNNVPSAAAVKVVEENQPNKHPLLTTSSFPRIPIENVLKPGTREKVIDSYALRWRMQ